MTDDKIPEPTGGQASPNDQTPEAPTSQQGQAEEQAQEQPKYVTVDDLARRDEEIIRRIKQSDRDRNKRIESELTAIRKRLQGAGIQPTTEQEAQLREQISQQVDGAVQEEGAPASEPDTEQLPPIVSQAIGMMNKAGIIVEEGDPEFDKFIKPLLAGPDVDESLLLATVEAMNAKKQRIASKKETAVIRSPGGGGATSGVSYTDAHDLWKKAYR